MDNDSLLDLVSGSAETLITLGGSIHPIVGSVVALLIVSLMVYFRFKGKSQEFEKKKKEVQEEHSETASDQDTIDSVQNDIEDFLNGDSGKANSKKIDDDKDYSDVFDHLKD